MGESSWRGRDGGQFRVRLHNNGARADLTYFCA